MTPSTRSWHSIKRNALSFGAVLLCSACVGAESPDALDGGLTAEEYLEKYCRGELPPPPEPERPLGPPLDPDASALTIASAVKDPLSSRITTLHLASGLTSSFSASAGGGTSSGLKQPGEYDVTLWLGGRKVLARRIMIHSGKQHALIYSGTPKAPLLTMDEVDVSAPEPGTRRARVSNRIHDGAPVTLYFYEKDDALVAETDAIADGATWAGTIPVSAVSFRLGLDDEASTELRELALWQPPIEGRCADATALGMVIAERSKLRPAMCGPTFTPVYAHESYDLHPAICASTR